jgi:hypothetical protein
MEEEEVMSDRFTLKKRSDEISSDRSVVDRCPARILDLTGPDFQGEKGRKNAVYFSPLRKHNEEMFPSDLPQGEEGMRDTQIANEQASSRIYTGMRIALDFRAQSCESVAELRGSSIRGALPIFWESHVVEVFAVYFKINRVLKSPIDWTGLHLI